MIIHCGSRARPSLATGFLYRQGDHPERWANFQTDPPKMEWNYYLSKPGKPGHICQPWAMGGTMILKSGPCWICIFRNFRISFLDIMNRNMGRHHLNFPGAQPRKLHQTTWDDLGLWPASQQVHAISTCSLSGSSGIGFWSLPGGFWDSK